MIPGPTLIKKCSECTNLIGEWTITSGNTFGATFWTDGKMDAPMLPDLPWLAKCPHCNALVWLDELEEIDTVSELISEEEILKIFGDKDRSSINYKNKYPNARYTLMPTFEDYLQKIENDSLPMDKERYIRIRVWHIGNDTRREQEQMTALSDKELLNLKQLEKLLDKSNDEERLFIAEINRELGDFDTAINLLDYKFDEQLFNASETIKKLSQKNIAKVAKIENDD